MQQTAIAIRIYMVNRRSVIYKKLRRAFSAVSVKMFAGYKFPKKPGENSNTANCGCAERITVDRRSINYINGYIV